jgi:putative tricarboxylic transport membrane protein
MQGRDGKIGVFLLMVSILLCYGAIELGIGKTHDPGPGFFPFLAGLIIALLSVILIISSFRPRPQFSLPPGSLLTGRAILTLGVFLITGLLVERAGFFICTFLVTIAMLRINGVKKLPFLFLVAILTSLGIYLVFNVLLDVRLPLGILRREGS